MLFYDLTYAHLPERYEKHSSHNERIDQRPRNAKENEHREKERERDKRRLQKSEELLETKRKCRPMSPPKVLPDNSYERYQFNDHQSRRSSKSIPSDDGKYMQLKRRRLGISELLRLTDYC